MIRRFPILAAFLVTTACQVSEQANDNAAVAQNDNGGAPTATNLPSEAPVATPVQSDIPPVIPNPPPPSSDKTAKGAIRVAQDYCDALSSGRLANAYALWSEEGRATGLTLKEFTAKFAAVRISGCKLSAPGEMEGAAGSTYIEIPAIILGTTNAGKPLRIEGPIVLRRVNDVDGSTDEQRRWHIARAEFPNG